MKRYVSIVLAVLNEEQNAGRLVRQIDKLIDAKRLKGILEVIFVDGGSVDSTVAVIKRLSKEEKRYRMRLMEQKVRGGTVAAQLEGSDAAKGSVIVIMDADLQHSPDVIQTLLDKKRMGFDVVVASRSLGYESSERSIARYVVSRTAQLLAYRFIKSSRSTTDPLSGFFVTDREYLRRMKPLPNFYKLLMYLLASNKRLRISEVNFSFANRQYGQSKVISLSMRFIRRYMKELLYYSRLELAKK